MHENYSVPPFAERAAFLAGLEAENRNHAIRTTKAHFNYLGLFVNGHWHMKGKTAVNKIVQPAQDYTEAFVYISFAFGDSENDPRHDVGIRFDGEDIWIIDSIDGPFKSNENDEECLKKCIVGMIMRAYGENDINHLDCHLVLVTYE